MPSCSHAGVLEAPRTGRPGHIGGTSPRDLSGSDEKCRDLSRRSALMPPASAEVGKPAALDRPTGRPASFPDDLSKPRVGVCLVGERRAASGERRAASAPAGESECGSIGTTDWASRRHTGWDGAQDIQRACHPGAGGAFRGREASPIAAARSQHPRQPAS
jgi:hypothetical protein